MKINKVIIDNFRQYYGENVIELYTQDEQNIILIGGRNGYGKTNFLLALVWCLYGEDISRIDENFRHEIQKDGNYSKFLKSSLNWDAAKEGTSGFRVQIVIEGIELPQLTGERTDVVRTCTIRREFDVQTSADEFTISIDGPESQMLRTEEDKINFINDYIIPVEAAKFVFFDAEKIASWAELSTKEEGAVLNDAVGKILGLDIYESLIQNLHQYTDTLRKESATAQLRQQIIATEKSIELNIEQIDELENAIIATENEIVKLKGEIAKYESFLVQYAYRGKDGSDLEELYQRKNELQAAGKQLEQRFHELCEIVPFAIAAGKLEEVVLHLDNQDRHSANREKQLEVLEKNDELIEKLFNQPPFPADGDISFSKKMFYADKAKKILESLFGDPPAASGSEFEHDLNHADNDFIRDTYSFIQKQSKDVFQQTIDNFNNCRNNVAEVEKMIRRKEADLEDEEVTEYTTKKADAVRKLEKLGEEKGALQNQKDTVKKANDKLNQELQVYLKRSNVSEQKKRKLDKANNYIKVLTEFVEGQKREKCEALSQAIYGEMYKLMHKLNTGSNKDFIAAVKAETLPGNDGLRIILYNSQGNTRTKESLSQGEKQIYISSLIKAILSLSIQEYPILIDTPLGRLDDEHIKQILLHYYPDLSGQVVLMATNNEIPPSRYRLVKDYVAQAYLLENNNNKSKFKRGYFQSYEN